MASIVPKFEYDIFISYRQKDNKGERWVTNFVNALKTELEATFKEDISIYFDENPHDGLLPNHDVDDSLKEKLKCLIFIPIISQTYCDKKSFAWESEFVAFKRMASDDQLGLKIKLPNGNVASRILPICIHELDEADQQMVEGELGVLRGIDFIYKAAGVVRPLKAQEEDARANLNHTFYNDQINKVARACKDLIAGMQLVNASSQKLKDRGPEIKLNTRKRIGMVAAVVCLLGLLGFGFYYFGGYGRQLSKQADRSIAVLPFENMNKDPEQDYFSNGIAEDILNHLTKISDLKVKSRTSTLQYKGTRKSITEIGDELSVGNVVEGSVRRVGDKVRIVVQLIDARTDIHLWSETYDRELKDVLALQSEIAIEIANALNARLTVSEKTNIEKIASHDVTAYDYFLKAREIVNKDFFTTTKTDFQNALALVDQSIKLDPSFAQALALKGRIWAFSRYIGEKNKIWRDSTIFYASKAIEADPTSPYGYLLRGQVAGFFGNSRKAIPDYHKAYELAPNDPEILYPYGWQLLREKDEKGADLIIKSITNRYRVQDPQYYTQLSDVYYYLDDLGSYKKLMQRARALAPGSAEPVLGLSTFYMEKKEYDSAINVLKGFQSIERWGTDNLAWLYFLKKDYKQAIHWWSTYNNFESTFEDSTQTVPYRHRLGMAYGMNGEKKKSDSLFALQLKISTGMISGNRGSGTWGGLSGAYYDRGICLAYFGKNKDAIQYLDSAWTNGFNWNWGWHHDPILEKLRGIGEFKTLMGRIDDDYAFRRRAFSNALTRAQAGNELKNILK